MTAEEFFKNNSRLRNNEVVSDMTNIMIEFAKYHVEQAFRQAVKSIDNSIETLSEPEILNKFLDSYPLENIK